MVAASTKKSIILEKMSELIRKNREKGVRYDILVFNGKTGNPTEVMIRRRLRGQTKFISLKELLGLKKEDDS